MLSARLDQEVRRGRQEGLESKAALDRKVGHSGIAYDPSQ